MSIGLAMLSVAENMTPSGEASINLFGNRCGHDPELPRYFEPSQEHKLRPSVIQYAINNLKNFYSNPTKWLKSLRLTRSSVRQERSEAREADASVLGVILHYVDLSSLRVGFHDNAGDFIALDMRFLARQVGWRTKEDDEKDIERIKKGLNPREKGIKRLWRSIARMKKAGYLTVHEQFKIQKVEGEETKYKGLAAIRTLSRKLFIELGISDLHLDRKRKEASKRLKEKKREYLTKIEKLVKSSQEALRSAPQAIKNVSGKLFEQSKNASSFQYQIGKDRACQAEKERQRKCFELRLKPENKNLTAEAFYKKFPHVKKQE